MSFELTPEIIDQIIFGMENQEYDFVVDVKTGHVSRVEDVPDDREVEPIPDWRSVDGYNLMERFVVDLRNPVVREELRATLASGKGVFRGFKDTLKQHPEAERLWFRFKEREMRREVYTWYNELRERWGLERIPVDLETETDNLIIADFDFARDSLSHEQAREYAHDAREEVLETLSSDAERALMEDFERIDDDDELHSITASTPEGDIVGVVGAVVHRDLAPAVAAVNVLFVEEEYRGLGLARELLNRLFATLNSESVPAVHLELPGNAGVIRNLLDAWRGEEISRRYRVDIRRWSDRQVFEE
ncbi:MAG: GNAT family N-acetyltransferase [Spirochaetales bacterium]